MSPEVLLSLTWVLILESLIPRRDHVWIIVGSWLDIVGSCLELGIIQQRVMSGCGEAQIEMVNYVVREFLRPRRAYVCFNMPGDVARSLT